MKQKTVQMFSTNKEYIDHCMSFLERKLSKFNSVQEIEENEDDVNAYANISRLGEPKNIAVLEGVNGQDIESAHRCILEGRFLSEHTAAGEATRLGLGTKYLINISELSAERIAELISQEKGKKVTKKEVLKEAGSSPEHLMPLSLGTRHMLQYSFDISNLALQYKLDPREVLYRQKLLVIVNEETADDIISQFIGCSFFGFKRENVLFMIQLKFHGIGLYEGKFYYDTTSQKRLHNHGQMVMQQTMNSQFFWLGQDGGRNYLTSAQYGEMLQKMDDKLSYNIEDLKYLTGAIDYECLAFALKQKDFRMMMEVVANNPENPQKGGMAAFDPVLGRNVMIESFQLKGIKNQDIKYLNKNFNHYPRPYDSWSMLKQKALYMPITIKHGSIYFQPVQGDINFLVDTLFFRRKELKPIVAWKSPATTPLAVRYLKMQDEQAGFRKYAARFVQSL